ncbi:RecF/RecN/SMC protein [Hesseltinella vesiculosa]|uniref:Structural maintenance of chromosomes protein n=1 Tax=Hesseltinella vesiculosa TaxID=101127 RepID=A0A1X2GIZ2_9FUNG|nr:RecF/RecN/SMC protein [Hesseltinella vesiculosa]
MYLEELIIEGFKSYVSRTHITSWDPQFNAITGLNGSGKSNILDAICFVLGITNLSHVRASNLRDLIYKRGQAGVTKASVTIVFNNENRQQSPVGFETYRQITVTRQVLISGKTKYILNGHNAQQQTVQNLFQSVQLNINNPHFLIMQGRITKVLNMKPAEILSMVEEAAGTKMFEDRKTKAFATMAKKERKVEEINSILREEITPRLDQLRTEKQFYLDYQKTETEMERLNRLVVSHEYHRHYQRLHRPEDDAREHRIEELKSMIEHLTTEMEALEEEKESALTRWRAQNSGNDTIDALETQANALANALVRLKTKLDLQKKSLIEEEATHASLTASKNEVSQSITEKRLHYEQIKQDYDQFKQIYDDKSHELQRTSDLIQSLTTGITAEEGHESGYREQLQAYKNTAMQSATAEKQARLNINHLQKELDEKFTLANQTAQEDQGWIKDIAAKKQSMASVQVQLSQLNWDPDQEQELHSRRSKILDSIHDLVDREEGLARKLSNLDFNYTNPTPDFDRTKVKGLVAELITLDKQNFHAATALEICAGGKLYNVVVQDEIVGSQLLDRGRLRRRYTLIPLNKIQGFRVSAEKLATAKRLAPGKVDLALSLVGCDDEVQVAMDWIFGSTLVCQDAETAKRVTFDNSVRVKSVTLDGDVYDPFGTISGGSKPQSSGLLIKVQQLTSVRQEIKQARHQLADIDKQLDQAQHSIAAYQQLKQRLDLQTHEVDLMESRLSKSKHSQLTQRVDQIQALLQEHEANAAAAHAQHQQAQLDVNRIERELHDFNANKQSKLDEMTKNVNDIKRQLQQSEHQLKEQQHNVQKYEFELEQLESDTTSNDQELTSCQATMDALNEAIVVLQQESDDTKIKSEETKAQLKAEMASVKAHNEEMNELETLHKQKDKQVKSAQLELQKTQHELERQQKEQQSAQQLIESLEQEHDWILDQRELFGEPNSPYDFRNINLTDTRKNLQKLVSKRDAMRKKINVRVMNMIDNVEAKEKSLMQMLDTVQKDRQKIEETINSLEEYKLEALDRTYRKVNKDFAEIFGDLLAGNTCKLQPPDGKTIDQGLEVKVCLGGVWKQSLTELSGGQRSLIALSLILSLLQFKPAPMYILDEVDAALDLSHTQNIGQLLRTRFRGSQFLVVSLKDGMFNNANVLFKTRFKDGTSVVECIKHGEAAAASSSTT